MKHIFLLFAFMVCATKAFPANDSTQAVKPLVVKKHAHYLIVNGTFFLQQFFNFATQTTTITPSPYIVEYKFLPGQHGFRIDAGGNFSSQKNFLDSSQVTINSNTSFNFRVGYVYQRNITKHWAIFAGADLISTIGISKLTVNNTEDVVITASHSYTVGAGPALGIQFAINNRIGLFTETAFYYQIVDSIQSISSVNFPESNNKTHSIENDLKFTIPTSLFFYVRL